MSALRPSRAVVLAIIVGLVIFLGGMGLGPNLVGNGALAQGADEQDLALGVAPSATDPSLSVPSVAFAPYYDGMDYSTQPLKVNSGLGHFRAPVYLPQGAVVTKLVVFGYDNLAGELYSVTLAKHVFTTNSEVVMAETVSADNPTNPQKNVDTTITDATITNNQATYFLTVYITEPGLEVQGVKIVYSY
jgi:hypothetical protein